MLTSNGRRNFPSESEYVLQAQYFHIRLHAIAVLMDSFDLAGIHVHACRPTLEKIWGLDKV